MASTKLRLLIDESITEPLASSIVRLVPSAVRSKASVGAGAKDETIVAFANSDRRTIVAMDTDFRKYDVSWGVIKMNSPDRADDDCLFAIFRTFWQSGFRSQAKNRRTSLSNDGVRIKNGVTIEHAWHPKPCAHRGLQN